MRADHQTGKRRNLTLKSRGCYLRNRKSNWWVIWTTVTITNMEFARVSSQTYSETLNSHMYGIDGRLSNSTKKRKQIINRKKWKPNPKEQRMFVSGNRKSNRWVVWTTVTIRHMLRDLPHQHVWKWWKTISYSTTKPWERREKTNVEN